MDTVLAAAGEDGFLLDRGKGGADRTGLGCFEVAPQIVIRKDPRQRNRARRGKRQVESRNALISLSARIGDERLPVLAEPFIEARELLRLDRCRITPAEIARRRISDAVELPLAKVISSPST